jgi:two-component system chemotaxis response regulator CheY
MKVLVLDDSKAARFMIQKILSEFNFETYEAENGQDALERLKENPDTELALVDWNMPVMNGLEFVEAVRANDSFKEMRIMMVTTETEMTQVVKAIEAGANEYVMKPFNGEVIQDKLKILGISAE